MPEFPKPTFPYSYQVDAQIEALRRYEQDQEGRAIPSKASGRLLVATWNIANLGVHERRDKDHRLIAEMISWFDLVAVQEVNDNLAGLRAIQTHLPSSWRIVFSDKGGNDERAAYLYDSSRVSLLEKAGEVAIPPRWASVVKVPGSEQKFEGFDRNPYLTGLLLRQPHSRRGQCPPLFRKRHCVSQESPFHGGVGGRPVGGSAVKVALRL